MRRFLARFWAVGALLVVVVLLALFFAELAAAQNRDFLGPNAVYRRVFASVTIPATSSPIYNVGQSQHVFVVIFPGAAGDVGPVQVRIEASYDNSFFFPISPDITRAKLLGGRVYSIETAYGPFPYVRCRSLLSTPGAAPMDVYYVGNVIPVVPVVIQLLDRFVL